MNYERKHARREPKRPINVMAHIETLRVIEQYGRLYSTSISDILGRDATKSLEILFDHGLVDREWKPVYRTTAKHIFLVVLTRLSIATPSEAEELCASLPKTAHGHS